MPKLSDETWARRRRHVLESAFRCFAHNGFGATTVEDVASESGMSLGALYRYVPGKDDLVAAALDETLGVLETWLDDLLMRDPVPTPRESLQAMVDLLDDERPYHLAGLIIQGWAEGLRRPEMGERSREAWVVDHRRLVTLGRRWKRAGHLAEDMRPSDAASTIALLVRGIVVDQTHFGGGDTERALRRTSVFGG